MSTKAASYDWRTRLTTNERSDTGSPLVVGTWISAAHVVSLIVEGWSWSDVLRTHPELDEDDIRACLAFTVEHDEPTPVPEPVPAPTLTPAAILASATQAHDLGQPEVAALLTCAAIFLRNNPRVTVELAEVAGMARAYAEAASKPA